jgi:hypothetical protein
MSVLETVRDTVRRLPRPREDGFRSALRDERVTARLGLWLGVCFGLAFVTGLISHNYYLHHPWLPLFTRPTWGYRVTQGVHVLSGTAAVPLLVVKLWSVYPKLFTEVPFGAVRRLVAHLAERISIAVLVAASITELTIGLVNITQWYPWQFSFRPVHYALAWVAVGALLLHVAVKLPVIRRALVGPVDVLASSDGPGPSRRDLLRAAGAASGLAVLGSAGITVPGLRKVSVFGVHSGDGPQGLPVTRSARAADVIPAALSPGWRLTVTSGSTTRAFSRDQLAALPQHTAVLPIACVEGWSKDARWTGVRLRDLLDEVGAPRGARVRFNSLQRRGAFGSSELPAEYADDPLTLLALELDGEPLAIDHGYPCRLMAPNRPGVLQTKWLRDVEVLG